MYILDVVVFKAYHRPSQRRSRIEGNHKEVGPDLANKKVYSYNDFFT